MKVILNHLPREFQGRQNAVIEANLKELTDKYPALRTEIRRSVEEGMRRARLAYANVDFEDPKAIIRMLVDKKELVACEIGHEEDKWQLQTTELWGSREIPGILR